MIFKILKSNKYIYNSLLYIREFKEMAINHLGLSSNEIEVINLLANDICNSKCTMCNIWQQKQEFEVSPDNLKLILSDKLFKNVVAVGVTGGEPTLRDDLVELYTACVDTLPKLKSMSIITNAIKYKDVLNKILSIEKTLKSKGVYFSVMVSLDGVGEIHDQHRGRQGNFETAVKLIKYLKANTKIPITIGCTITKSNVFFIGELLDWVIENEVYARFRIGEFITRLYNNDLKEEIRAFNDIEIYHLTLFYNRLLRYEKNPKYKRTYRSIISVLNNESRTIGCPYHANGVVLSSKGELLYCAPKSKILGSTLDNPASDLYKKNIGELDRIKEDHCHTCIHDYHANATFPEYHAIVADLKWRIINKLQVSWFTYRLMNLKSTNQVKEDSIFITGWYGTETVGDKAILGHIVNYYSERYNGIKIKVSSLYPFITKQTLIELGLEYCEVIPYYSRQFIDSAAESSVTVMGGGPLMDMNGLAIPLNAFRVAKKNKKETVIFGCGLGPLRKLKYIKTVKKILQLADKVLLRDSDSIAFAKKIVPSLQPVKYGDPAHYYISNNFQTKPTQEKKPILACYLRDWPIDYAKYSNEEQYFDTKNNFEKNLSKLIKYMCSEFNLVPHFYSMHNFNVGGDDRIFYRRFVRSYFKDEAYYIESKPSSVKTIVDSMQMASINLCMRFHSVLFAHTLGINYMAIDYTNGGKIRGFLDDNDSLNKLVELQDIASGNFIKNEIHAFF